MRKLNIRLLSVSLFFIVFIASPAQAAIEAVEFATPELQQRYQSLIAELRCTVCQNQNLADSNADLAKDLRRKTEEMLKAGQSDDDILTYMRDRYGDFVLYRPPMSGSTSVLWIAPFILLFVAIISVLITVRNKKKVQLAQNELSSEKQSEQLQKIRDLLDKS